MTKPPERAVVVVMSFKLQLHSCGHRRIALAIACDIDTDDARVLLGRDDLHATDGCRRGNCPPSAVRRER